MSSKESFYNGNKNNIDKIAELFPSCITETNIDGDLQRAIDFDKLRQLLSEDVVEGVETYELSWVGKKRSIVEAYKPTDMVLRPCQEDSVDWDNTQNIYIEGDNLEVLKILQESYKGLVKLIYIDPPYNTGRNYIYRNDFSLDNDAYLKESKVINEDGARLVKNERTFGRFHSAWLSMMYERLLLAKSLLSSHGVLICAIDDNEFAALSLIMKEIWDETGYEHSYVTVQSNGRGQQGKNISCVNEYLIIVCPKDGNKYIANVPKEKNDNRTLRDSGSESSRSNASCCFYPFYLQDGQIIRIGDVPDNSYHPEQANVFCDDGIIEVWPIDTDGKERKWRYARDNIESHMDQLSVKETVRAGRRKYDIYFNQVEETVRSIWDDPKYDASEHGTKLLKKLFPDADVSFTYPKSLYAVLDCVYLTTKDNKDAIVMDFFSGSSTTAHAVMEVNLCDNGKRKYIMVQLQEDLDEALQNADKKDIKKSIENTIKYLKDNNKPHNICEIGKERIRRAGDKIKEDKPLVTKDLDVGFRVFKLDSSNIKNGCKSSEEYSKDLLNEMISNIEDNRNDLDLLFECLLKFGIPSALSLSYDIEKMYERTVYTVHCDDGDIIACFDEAVPIEAFESIASRKPYRVVFKDAGFYDSSIKIDAMEQFKRLSPDTQIKVI